MIREFNISFDREEFEAMYFANFEDSYLLSSKMKPRFIAVLAITIIMPLITVSAHDKWPAIMLISWFLFVALWVDFTMAVFKTRSWKRGILKALDAQSRVQVRSLQLYHDKLILIEDGQQTVKKWSDFHESQISARFIWLQGDTDYYFPSSSMSLDDYQVMCELVKDKTHPEEIDLLDEG